MKKSQSDESGGVVGAEQRAEADFDAPLKVEYRVRVAWAR